MESSLCLLVIICVFACSVEGGGRHGYYGYHPRPYWQQPSLPEGITQICGATTSPDLAEDVFQAYTLAKKYSLAGRNDDYGWTPAPFTSTARGVMNLQLSTDADWYSEQPRQPSNYYGYGRHYWYSQQTADWMTKLSVKQLENEVLAFLTSYLRGEDSLQVMGHTEFAHNLVALSFTCRNIFDFYGTNLYDVMNERLMRFGDGVTVGAPLSGPATGANCDSLIPGGAANRDFFYGFGLLVACQNAEVINPDFFRCTIEAQNNGLYAVPLIIPGLGPYPLGYGDLQLLGMSCLRDRVPAQYKVDWDAVMTRISDWMSGMQVADGSFAGNPIATTLAIQTLKAAEADFNSWDCEGAVRNLLTFQDAEGQIFGSLGITMLAMTTIAGESMASMGEIMPECDIA